MPGKVRPLFSGEKHRISQRDKEEAVAAVKSGLTPHHIAQRMGVYHTTVGRWVKAYGETSEARPAGKFEPYVDAIVPMIEADPTRRTHALWKDFKKAQCIHQLFRLHCRTRVFTRSGDGTAGPGTMKPMGGH